MVNDEIKDAELVASNSALVAELRKSFFDKLEKDGPPKPGRWFYIMYLIYNELSKFEICIK